MKKVDVIVGCQYGSEGKGLVASKVEDWFKAENDGMGYDLLVSVNSSQAGHTTHRFDEQGNAEYFVTRQLPASAIANTEAKIFIAPGAIVNPSVLFEEIKMLEKNGIPISNRLYLSDVACMITHEDEEDERKREMFESIGSTMEGVGSALSKHVLRTGRVMSDYKAAILKEFPDVSFVSDTRALYQNHRFVLLEGSQGFGLGINYRHYPYCTSRDTTVAGALAGAQIPHGLVSRVYGVYRTYPIRVAGNSGHLSGELTWEDVASRSGYPTLKEITTVTKRVRRVGVWDNELALDSMFVNGVTHPILTFVNYLNSDDEGKTTYPSLSEVSRDWLEACPVKFFKVSTSKEGGWITPE